MRRDPSNLMPKGHKHVGFWSRFFANPASGVIVLGMLTGNAAIHIIRIKREMKLYSRKTDQKIELLREVIQRVQNGENVDVEKLLGTGDPNMEEEWFDGTSKTAPAVPSPSHEEQVGCCYVRVGDRVQADWDVQ
jgi:hypothetical protein